MTTLIRTTAPSLIVLVVLVVAVLPAWAQDDDLNSDRPGVGTSAITVPRGVLQLETGVEYARERRAGEATQRRTSLATAFRYGLLDGVELRLEGEPIVSLRGEDDATNVGDFLLGAKLRLLEGGEGALRPTLAILPAVKMPTAPDPIGTERADVLLLGLASFNFGRVSADVNAGVAAIGQRGESGYLVQGLVTGTLTADVTDKLKLLGEVFYNSPSERDGEDVVGVVAGIAYLLTKRLAIDTAFITALAGRGPDYRIQIGLTVRFGS
jgi:hypothetical protein